MVITHKAAAIAAKQSRLLSFIPCESCGKRASSLAAAAVMGRDWEQPVSQQESIEPPGCDQHLVNARHKQQAKSGHIDQCRFTLQHDTEGRFSHCFRTSMAYVPHVEKLFQCRRAANLLPLAHLVGCIY